MKLLKLFSAIAMVALLGMPVAAQAQTQSNGGSATGATPLLMIESFTHDFGEVKAGTPLRHAFKIKNLGKADLLIHSVSPG